MGERARGRSGSGGTAIGLVVLLPVLLTGCAASIAAAPSSSSSSSSSSAAQRLLQQVALPAGATRVAYVAAVPVPFQSSDLGCDGLVERTEYWRLPTTSTAAAQDWLRRHVPAGFRVAGTGTGGDGSGRTMSELDLAVHQADLAPAGSRLVLMAVGAGAATFLRVSAQVVPAAGCGPVTRYAPLHGPAHQQPL